MKKIFLLMAAPLALAACLSGNTPAKGAASASAPMDYSTTPPNAEFVFVAAHNGNLENYNHLALMVLKNYVESRANGRIGIRIIPNGQLAANVNEGIGGLQNGNVDIFQTTGDFAAFWPHIAIFDLPYVLSSDRIAEAIFADNDFIDEIRRDILKTESCSNARLMVVGASGGWRNFAATKKQIKSPDDVKGMKFRTVPAKVQQELVRKMGGAPTPMPWPEVYTALSTGVVDGTKNGLVDIVSAKLHESLKFISLDGHAYMSGYWFINNKKFTSMPEDLRQIMADGLDAMKIYLNAYPKFAEINAIAAIKEKGGTLYTPNAEELAKFKAIAKPMQEWFLQEQPQSKPWLDKYLAVVRKQEAILKNAADKAGK